MSFLTFWQAPSSFHLTSLGGLSVKWSILVGSVMSVKIFTIPADNVSRKNLETNAYPAKGQDLKSLCGKGSQGEKECEKGMHRIVELVAWKRRIFNLCCW